ncbi:diguanylate cyclase [Thiorhodococcus mannitoliphagus]|uniref:Diguanylate cyclase n=1 Tax=Thiorhodococcus mannitoliphagus TaxID=329406 RepID=A0A6P1E1K0_9GAMM|nr:diguanylate cyclase [Thiorhodococcus mannitoliphagus]NEX21605.1 diguanylate cyclase [Thiorhodococcus mannitoliphagus]
MTLDTNTEERPLALVVDDDPVLRLAVKQFVERLGFETQVATDGRAAVELFTKVCPDIVLLDAAMPEMDGFAACAAMRALPEGAHVPVIMITVYEDESSVDQAFNVGADEYITKPIHWAVLRNRVLHLVSSYRAERQLRDDHAFFQSLVDSIPDPTVVVDTNLVVRWVNSSAPGFFAFEAISLGDPLAFHAKATIDDDSDTPLLSLITNIVTHPKHQNETIECVLSVGTAHDNRFFAQLHARALRGVQGQVHGFILRLQDVTTRERLRSEASHLGDLARHDSLTGLANRMLFEERLRSLIARHDGTDERRVALLFLDLDGFKAINDSYGHAAGDQLLRAVAGRLESLVRRGDLVSRLGGDEFGILLTEVADLDVIKMLAERLLDSVRAPVVIGGESCSVSASIGIGVFPDHAESGEDLERCADSAMYRVKNAGKSGIRFAEPIR